VHPVKLVIAIVTTSLSVLLIIVTVNYIHTGGNKMIGETASYLGLSSVFLFVFFCCFDELLVFFGKSIEK
jgi:hypothetical protein